jgi:hypothetical protein
MSKAINSTTDSLCERMQRVPTRPYVLKATAKLEDRYIGYLPSIVLELEMTDLDSDCITDNMTVVLPRDHAAKLVRQLQNILQNQE